MRDLPTEQCPIRLFQSIIPLSINTINMPQHDLNYPVGFYQQMVMITHQAISMDFNTKTLMRLVKAL